MELLKDIPSTPISVGPEATEKSITAISKRIFQTTPQILPISIDSALNLGQKKRPFNLDFQDIEEAPSKAFKSTKTQRILQFQAGSNGSNIFTKTDLLNCVSTAISVAIQPLISEIQALKTEVTSLKNAKNVQIPTQNLNPLPKSSSKPVKKTALIPQSIKDSMNANNNQKSIQKTWAEISKLENLVTEQSNKLDKWTVIGKKNSPKKELTPKKGLEPVDRRILFRRTILNSSVNIPDLLLAINLAIKKCGLPDHIRLLRLWESPSGAISGQLKEGANAEMLYTAKEEILKAAKKLDPSIISIEAAEQWYPLRVHKVCLQRYLNPTGMEILKEEIESTSGLNLPLMPRWINQNRAEERYQNEEILYSTVVIKVRSKLIANSLIAKGIEFGGKNHPVELFLEIKADTICSKCSQFDHNGHKICENQAKCAFCGLDHETKDHKCQLKGCSARPGTLCIHTPIKCINCKGPHLTSSNFCPKKQEILVNMRKSRKEAYLKLQQSRQKIAVIVPSRSSLNPLDIEDLEMDIETVSSQESEL